MLYIKRRSLRHVNLPGGRCYQRACLSGQGQANTTHLPVSPSVTGKNDPGIGGRSQCEAGGRQGEAETVTVHAQCFQEDLSPGRTPAAGGDMNAVHQRLYPCLRMSSAASSWMTFSLSCVRARCSISEVAEPRGKCSARIWRARSLAVEPKLLILDEAVSNLDLVLQAGVIRLLKKLQQQFGTACLFITHDLRLVERFCQRVMVMDNGQIVETQAVGEKLTFSSDAGRVLQNAVLPAFPVRRRTTEKV